MEVKEAIETLRRAMTDPEPGSYRYGWQCNIAMAFKDQCVYGPDDPSTREGQHAIANKAAVRFLEMLFPLKEPDLDMDGMSGMAAIAQDCQTVEFK